jgi:large subunit ribosomal protein L21
VSQTRGPKIIIFRRKRRKNHRRTQGHKQDLTLLKVTDILTSAKAPAAKKAAPAAKKSEDKPAETKAAKKAAPAAKKSESKPAQTKAAKKAAPKKAATKKA